MFITATVPLMVLSGTLGFSEVRGALGLNISAKAFYQILRVFLCFFCSLASDESPCLICKGLLKAMLCLARFLRPVVPLPSWRGAQPWRPSCLARRDLFSKGERKGLVGC